MEELNYKRFILMYVFLYYVKFKIPWFHFRASKTFSIFRSIILYLHNVLFWLLKQLLFHNFSDNISSLYIIIYIHVYVLLLSCFKLDLEWLTLWYAQMILILILSDKYPRNFDVFHPPITPTRDTSGWQRIKYHYVFNSLWLSWNEL